MIELLLRAGLAVYRAIDSSPPWAWVLAGALAGIAFLEVVR